MLSESVARKVIENNEVNIYFIDSKLQAKFVTENPHLLNYANVSDILEHLFQNTEFNDVLKKACLSNPKLLAKINKIIGNPNVTKKYYGIKTILEDTKIIQEDSIQAEDTIVNLFLHSGVGGAKGTLVPDSLTPAGIGGKSASLAGVYFWENGEAIDMLNTSQIYSLIRIDSNYILPRLATNLEYLVKSYFHEKDIEESKKDCKEIFERIYGKQRLARFSNIIDSIYEMQEQKNKQRELLSKKTASKIPLQYFKILFNQAIMDANAPENIEKYFSDIFNGRDSSESFKTIIKEAYGDKAVKILENRPQLDVHEINSLEIFDRRITDNFSEAFVNDLISYNIEEFSRFLEIVKTPEKLDIFKKYYSFLSCVIGKNIFTMQRAILDYDYIENIMKEIISNKGLTTEQLKAFTSYTCSTDKHKFKMESVQDLLSYDEQANNILKKAIKIDSPMQMLKREEIIKSFFGESILGGYAKLKTFEVEKYFEDKSFSSDEIEILQCLNFILEESDTSKILEFVSECTKQKGIRNPISAFSAIHKAIERQLEMINSTFISKKIMDEAILQYGDDVPNEKRSVYKEVIDGIEYYHLNGIPFGFLVSGSFYEKNISLKNVIEHDGQIGSNSISMRYLSSEIIDVARYYLNNGSNWYGEDYIKPEEIITISNTDGAVDSDNKKIMIYGRPIEKYSPLNGYGNEVAIYRRGRDHYNRPHEEIGGKKIPKFWIGPVSQQDAEMLRKYHIPVYIVHFDKYQTKTKEKQNDVKEELLEI